MKRTSTILLLIAAFSSIIITFIFIIFGLAFIIPYAIISATEGPDELIAFRIVGTIFLVWAVLLIPNAFCSLMAKATYDDLFLVLSIIFGVLSLHPLSIAGGIIGLKSVKEIDK